LPLTNETDIKNKEVCKMEDFDDFDDGFDDDDFFEDSFNEDFEAENLLDDDSGIEGEATGDDIYDADFTAQDAFFLGSAMGWAYEEVWRKGSEGNLRKRWILRETARIEKMTFSNINCYSN